MCTVYTCHTVCHLYTTSTRVQLDTFLDVNVSSVPHVHALHVADSVPCVMHVHVANCKKKN
jgi:hypothetical protein